MPETRRAAALLTVGLVLAGGVAATGPTARAADTHPGLAKLVVHPQNHGVMLRWPAGNDAGGFDVELFDIADTGLTTPVRQAEASIDPLGTAYVAQVRELPAGARYVARVTAGDGSTWEPVVTPEFQVYEPVAPVTNVKVRPGGSRLHLSWTAPRATPLTGALRSVRVTVLPHPTLDDEEYAYGDHVVHVPAGRTSVTYEGAGDLRNGVTYRMELTPIAGAHGWPASSEFGRPTFGNELVVEGTPHPAPGKPRRPAADPEGTKRAVLTWKKPSTRTRWPITDYRVVVDGERVATVGPKKRRHVVRGLKPGRAYRIAVRAHNDAGTSRPAVTRLRPRR